MNKTDNMRKIGGYSLMRYRMYVLGAKFLPNQAKSRLVHLAKVVVPILVSDMSKKKIYKNLLEFSKKYIHKLMTFDANKF